MIRIGREIQCLPYAGFFNMNCAMFVFRRKLAALYFPRKEVVGKF